MAQGHVQQAQACDVEPASGEDLRQPPGVTVPHVLVLGGVGKCGQGGEGHECELICWRRHGGRRVGLSGLRGGEELRGSIGSVSLPCALRCIQGLKKAVIVKGRWLGKPGKVSKTERQ